MDLIEVLEKQITLLDEMNEELKETDPIQVRDNISTIDDLVRTIHFIENN